MTLRRTLVAVVGCLMFLGAVTGAKADTLDFTEVGSAGIVPFTIINLSNAKLTSFGDDMFIGASGSFGEKNKLGIVCASPVRSNNCQEDLQIDFFSAVSNLMFSSFGAGPGDRVTVSAFRGATLVGNALVMTNTTLDFSALGNIDRLFFADASTAAGIGWGDFSFDPTTTSVPEPYTLALLGFGLVGVGFVRLRKTSHA